MINNKNLEKLQALFQSADYIEAQKIIDGDVSLANDERGKVIQAAIFIRTNQPSKGLEIVEQLELVAKKKSAELINLRSLALRAQKKYQEAAECLREGVKEFPKHIDLLHNLAVTLSDLGEHEQSVTYEERALLVNPNFIEGIKNLGRIHISLRNTEAAKKAFNKLNKLLPNSIDVYVGLGAAYLIDGESQLAIDYFEKALKQDQNLATALANIGIAYKFLGDYDKAEHFLKRACLSDPNQIEHQWNLALAQLAGGNFKEGWENYEVRYSPKRVAPDRVKLPNSPIPMLKKGDDIRGKTIVLLQEQGYGDTIQFYRYAEHLKHEGAKRIIAVVTQPLVPLIQTIPWIDEVHSGFQTQNSMVDYWTYAMSLPYRYDLDSVEKIPKKVGYFRVYEETIQKWRALLPVTAKKLRVGLVWAGRDTHTNDRRRSLSLSQLNQLAELQSDIEFVSLQIGDRENDDAEIDWNILKFGKQITDFSDSAGLLANLDLLITIDSAPAHLAGALGMPVWVLIPSIFDFRWLKDISYSPWYPSMKLFRQKDDELTWSRVIADLKRELVGLLHDKQHVRWVPAKIHGVDDLKAMPLAGNQYFVNVAYQHQLKGNLLTAISLYEEILITDPLNVDVIRNLAVAYRGINDIEKALQLYQLALENSIRDHNIFLNYANLLWQLERVEACFNAARKCLEIDARNPIAWSLISKCQYRNHQYEEASKSINQALMVSPQNYDYLIHRVLISNQLKNQDSSYKYLNELKKINPDALETHMLEAQTYVEYGSNQAALDIYNTLEASHSDVEDLYVNRAVVHARNKNYQKAIEDTRRALAIKPDYAEAHVNLSLYLLTLGEFKLGWDEYEWRMDSRRTSSDRVLKPNLSKPMWQGQDLLGKTILLMPEQGYGDHIQFIRYAEWLKSKGASILVASHEALRSILETCPWIDRLVGDGDQVQYDFWTFPMSLPRLAQTDIASIPKSIPYLKSKKDDEDVWHQKLVQMGVDFKRPLVGLCWSGSSANKRNSIRSIPIEIFHKHLSLLENCQFIAINYGENVVEFSRWGNGQLINLGKYIKNFSDTAAIIHHLKILITIDSAPAHLAGAMGKNAWVLLDDVPDFRWMLERSDSLWYPTLKIYRKQSGWDSLMIDVKNDLEKELLN